MCVFLLSKMINLFQLFHLVLIEYKKITANSEELLSFYELNILIKAMEITSGKGRLEYDSLSTTNLVQTMGNKLTSGRVVQNFTSIYNRPYIRYMILKRKKYASINPHFIGFLAGLSDVYKSIILLHNQRELLPHS